MLRKFLVVVVLALFATQAFVSAQEEKDYEAFYEGIPFSRLEDGGFVLGDPEAPVTVVEFADFLCPHCQNYQETAHQFIETYVKTGQAKFEYRMFPVVNPVYSNLTAQLAECADEQREGAFWPAHDVLYDLSKAGNVGPDTTETLASTLSLDADALATCAETADQYQIDSEVGNAVGVSGTPATLVRNAEGELGWVRLEGRTFNGGGLPFELLTQVMEAEDLNSIVVVPQALFGDFFLTEDEITEETTCVAPCWNGITPGTTTFEEATAIIEADSQTSNAQSAADPSRMQWTTLASDQPNYVVADEEEVVNYLRVMAPSETTIGRAIAAVGEPSSALASQTEQGAVVVILIFPEQSMVVTGFILPDDSGEFALSEDTELIGVDLFAPADFESAIAESGLALVDWAGYEALDSYLGN